MSLWRPCEVGVFETDMAKRPLPLLARAASEQSIRNQRFGITYDLSLPIRIRDVWH